MAVRKKAIVGRPYRWSASYQKTQYEVFKAHCSGVKEHMPASRLECSKTGWSSHGRDMLIVPFGDERFRAD